jgi:nanoRNase/pAp phosphatase (c-di-AMP/oligoRNAs hydrolase)
MPAAIDTDNSRRRRTRDADEPPERGGRPRPLSVAPAPFASSREGLDALLAAVKGKQRALVLTHDNPDPDSLASAMGAAFLLEKLAHVPARVAFGGIVGRAENRALVRVLKLPVVPLARLAREEFDFVMLVDTQPECGNHSLEPCMAADAAIDHHPTRETSLDLSFAEVGGDYGATASILTSYVRASGLELPQALATALFYGIKSDTRDLGREFSQVDVDNYHWLFPQVDHAALSQIEHPAVPPSYFAAFHRAFGRARRHDEAVVADLGPVYAPDIVAEVADRLLSLEEMRWSLALGEYEGELYFSIRTSDRRMNAGRLAGELVRGHEGSAGGHGSMAGGRLVVPSGSARARAAFRKRLLTRFLDAVGAPRRGTRIV